MFTKQTITEIFEKFSNKNVLIIGDVMLDAYLFGKVTRISPEAPAPIVALEKRISRLGGASNVALNIKALGANPILCSVIGEDEKGEELLQILLDHNMTTEGFVLSKERQTTVKSRVIGNSTQLLRIDEENIDPLTIQEETDFLKVIRHILENRKIDVVLFQDYDKGAITENIIKNVTDYANTKNIPITVDPKKRNFLKYKNVTLFKPNLKELCDGISTTVSATDEHSVKQAIVKLKELIDPEIVMLTLSEHGIVIQKENIFRHFPAFLRNISDVSGAGDTVISVATLCLTIGMELDKIAQLSNLAGGIVCEQVGVIPIKKEQLITESLKLSL